MRINISKYLYICIMKKITSLTGLKSLIVTGNKVWMLLYKSGSEQSECAVANFNKVESVNGNILCAANVLEARDIHPEYNITSVPSLLYFENGNLKNVAKGCQTPGQLKAIFEKPVFIASAPNNEKSRRNVTVYTTPTCSWCTTIKRHLQENGIPYREVNVEADQKAAEEMVRKSGQQGVPQTEINGQIVVGFDKTRINSLLGLN